MKWNTVIILSALFCHAQAYAMTRVESPGSGNGAVTAKPIQGLQSGKVVAVYASAAKLVIGGVAYAYSPTTTVVVVEGKRSTISDVRVGDAVQFESSSQGAHQPALLTSIQVQRR